MTERPGPQVLSDAEVSERLRRGDSEAFDYLFRTWYAPLVRMAEGMLRNRASAEEIVQDVMLGLWRRRESFSAQGSPQGYLFRATRNRALNQLRHQKIQRQSEPLLFTRNSVPAAADAKLAEEEIQAALQDAVSSLPDRCREVFELSRVHGLKYSEIAEALEISVKTVETQMGKALRVLREKLAAWLPEGKLLKAGSRNEDRGSRIEDRGSGIGN